MKMFTHLFNFTEISSQMAWLTIDYCVASKKEWDLTYWRIYESLGLYELPRD